MNQVYKSTGRKPKGLIAPKIYDCASYLWGIFISLRETSMVEIKAYSDLYRYDFKVWELNAISALSDIKLKDYSESSK